MNRRELEMKIIDNAKLIAELLDKGKDVELRNAKEGLRVIEVTKKVRIHNGEIQ